MATVQENLLAWLRDAHAMELQAEQLLRAQLKRIEHYPTLKTRVEEHLQETLGQQKVVEECIRRLGGEPSTMKDLAAEAMAWGHAAAGMFANDEVLKDSLASFAFENVEIASYTMLIAAARDLGDEETARACESILPQEQAMAAWILKHLPELTSQYLARDVTPGAEAKR